MSEYKLVPVDPTEEMVRAVGDVIGPCETPEQIYRAMLAAAPDAPAVQAEPVAWALYVRRKDTEWSRYAIYDTEKQAQRTLKQVSGDPLIVEVRPLYLHPPAPAVAWQDISTAPKDGAQVIVTGLIQDKGPERWVAAASYGDGVWFGDNGDVYYPPTHWMPMPTPPNGGV